MISSTVLVSIAAAGVAWVASILTKTFLKRHATRNFEVRLESGDRYNFNISGKLTDDEVKELIQKNTSEEVKKREIIGNR